MPAVDEKIEAAIRALQLQSGADDHIPATIDLIRLKSGLAAVNELSRAIPCSLETAEAELTEFVNLAKQLIKHVHSMHRTSLEKFEQSNTRWHPLMLEHDLRIMIDKATQKYTPRAVDHTKKKSGRPAKHQAKVLVEALVRVYQELTGKPAARSNVIKDVNNKFQQKPAGEFVDFVTAVRDALELDFSVDSQCRAAILALSKK